MDYILGLEKEDNSSNPARNTYYKTFSSPMQRILTSYCQSGGHLLVSGAYVGSDMDSSQGNKEFIQNILKYRHGNSLKTDGDKIAVRGLGHTFTLPRLPNEQSYPVTSPDCILPMSPAFQS